SRCASASACTSVTFSFKARTCSATASAARLETLAEPGGICVSGAVRDYVGKKLPMVFTDCGEQSVKNIAEPVRVYRVGRAQQRRSVPPRGRRYHCPINRQSPCCHSQT